DAADDSTGGRVLDLADDPRNLKLIADGHSGVRADVEDHEAVIIVGHQPVHGLDVARDAVRVPLQVVHDGIDRFGHSFADQGAAEVRSGHVNIAYAAGAGDGSAA